MGMTRGATASFATVALANGLSERDLTEAEANGPPLASLKVVKRLPDADGPVLLELGDEDRLALQREYPGARLVPEGTARMAFMSLILQEVAAMTGVSTASPSKLRVRVRDAKGNRPLLRTEVQCIFNHRTNPPIGATAQTDAHGIATFLVPARFKKVDVIVNPRHTVWPAARKAIVLGTGTTSTEIVCPHIIDASDCAHALYQVVEPNAGRGVVVAVIDGGAGPHASLDIASGANLVDGEADGDFRDNGIGHGTHVAGLIAGKGTQARPGGFAQAVTLKVYRVYAKNEISTGSFAIAEAIRRAVNDGADLINLSLTLPSDQPEIVRELKRARASGVAIIAAAGNEATGVMFPARLSGVLAVSAMGVMGSAPAGSSVDEACLEKPKGTEPKHRIAEFSCSGPEVDLIGPGVGLVSLFPGGKRAIMSGTSMAAPVVTGRIARALANNADLLQQERVQGRSDAISRMALRAVKSLGFVANLQGQGLPE